MPDSTDTPSSSSSASSSASSASSSPPPGRVAERGISIAWLAIVGVFSYAWLFTHKTDGWAWQGILGFWVAAILPKDSLPSLATQVLDRLLPRRPEK